MHRRPAGGSRTARPPPARRQRRQHRRRGRRAAQAGRRDRAPRGSRSPRGSTAAASPARRPELRRHIDAAGAMLTDWPYQTAPAIAQDGSGQLQISAAAPGFRIERRQARRPAKGARTTERMMSAQGYPRRTRARLTRMAAVAPQI
jgi:hypothetical protein